MFNLINADDTLKLDNQFCFVLYALSRQVTALYRPLLKPLGLTYPQYLVMLVLWEAEGADVGELREGIPVKALCSKLMLDTGTLTPLLKRMEQQGLIVRNRSRQDEREVRVMLTEAGQLMKDKAKDIPFTMLCQSRLPMDRVGPLQAELKALLAMMADQD